MLDLSNAIFKKLPHQNDTDFVVTSYSPTAHYQTMLGTVSKLYIYIYIYIYICVCVCVCVCVCGEGICLAYWTAVSCIVSIQTKPNVKHGHQNSARLRI